MKALITGAAGFIGSHLTTALLDRGAEVTGIDCFTDYYPRFIKEMNLAVNKDRPGYTFVEASLQEADLPALLSDHAHCEIKAAQSALSLVARYAGEMPSLVEPLTALARDAQRLV